MILSVAAVISLDGNNCLAFAMVKLCVFVLGTDLIIECHLDEHPA
jgi:hypothetical protein